MAPGLFTMVPGAAAAVSCAVLLLTVPAFPSEKEKEAGGASSAGNAAGKNPGKQEAVARFKKGVEFFNEQNFSAALVEFLESYKIVPNWALFYNIAVCYEGTGKTVEALEEYQKYLDAGGDKVPAERKAEVEASIKELEGKIGYLILECSEEGSTVIIDEYHERQAGKKEAIPLLAGFHTIAVKKAGFEPFKKEISIATGENKILNVTLSPLGAAAGQGTGPPGAEKGQPGEGDRPAKKKMKKPLRWLWAGLGAGVAIGAAAVATGALAMTKRDDMRAAADACEATVAREDCPDAYDLQDQAGDLVMATNVLAGLAGAAALTGLILFILDKPKPVEEKSKEKKIKKEPGKGISGIMVVPAISTKTSPYVGLQAGFDF